MDIGIPLLLFHTRHESMDHNTTAQAALLISLGLMLYSYMGYPLFLRLLSLFRSRASSSERDSTPWPEVSIIISAHNEESVIGRRIENLLDLDYPPDRVQILIGS